MSQVTLRAGDTSSGSPALIHALQLLSPGPYPPGHAAEEARSDSLLPGWWISVCPLEAPVNRSASRHTPPASRGTAAVSIALTGSPAVLTFPRVPEELPAAAELRRRRTRRLGTRARKAAGVVSGSVGVLA